MRVPFWFKLGNYKCYMYTMYAVWRAFIEMSGSKLSVVWKQIINIIEKLYFTDTILFLCLYSVFINTDVRLFYTVFY